MIINNANINGKICNIIINNGKILEITTNKINGDLDAEGNEVIPGLIDIHTHGCIGYDTMNANFEPMCKFYAENGITSFLPTTMTADYEDLKRVTEAKTNFKGANILGFHLEGPYISKEYKGAQNENYIRNPDINEFESLKNIKMITMAPEKDENMQFIKEVSKKCIVSIGHTNCSYNEAIFAIESGANCLTHMFNAMPQFHHRNSGPIGAAVEKEIYSQIICDGIHISKSAIIAAYKMFGANKLILISDSLCCAGLPDGKYESGGLVVYLKDGKANLEDGTIAGSSVTLLDCVKKAIEFGISREDAIKMATQTPAKLLGVKKGVVDVGYDSDLLIVDNSLNIKHVIIGENIIK